MVLGVVVASCSSGGLDPRLQEALTKLQEMNVDGAKRLVKEVLEKHPQMCEAHLVRQLVGFQGIAREINAINNLFSIIQSDISALDISQIVDTFLRELLEPVEEFASMMYESSDVVWRKGCRVYVEDFPLQVNFGSTVSISVHLRGLMGATESIVFSAFSGALLSAMDLMFSHDLSINISSVMDLYTLIRTDRFIYLLRTLGNFMEMSPNFLNWHPDPLEKARFENIPERMADVSEKLASLVDTLSREGRDKRSFVRFYDNGDGTLDYGDTVCINFDGEVEVYAKPYTVQPYSFDIPYWVTQDLLDQANDLLLRLSAHMRGESAEALTWFHISEINGFLLAMGEEAVPDIIAIQPMAFFAGPATAGGFPNPPQPKPLRELVPYWYKDPVLGNISFMIEGEIKDEFSGDFYINAGDSPHFPDSITFYGETVTGLSIPYDCISVPSSLPDYYTLVYTGFQDPSFNGALKVNLAEITVGGFCFDQDTRPSYQDFNFPDLYSVNKVFAFLSLRFGSFIVPGLDYLFQESEDLGNLFDYSSAMRLFFPW